MKNAGVSAFKLLLRPTPGSTRSLSMVRSPLCRTRWAPANGLRSVLAPAATRIVGQVGVRACTMLVALPEVFCQGVQAQDCVDRRAVRAITGVRELKVGPGVSGCAGFSRTLHEVWKDVAIG